MELSPVRSNDFQRLLDATACFSKQRIRKLTKSPLLPDLAQSIRKGLYDRENVGHVLFSQKLKYRVVDKPRIEAIIDLANRIPHDDLRVWNEVCYAIARISPTVLRAYAHWDRRDDLRMRALGLNPLNPISRNEEAGVDVIFKTAGHDLARDHEYPGYRFATIKEAQGTDFAKTQGPKDIVVLENRNAFFLNGTRIEDTFSFFHNCIYYIPIVKE